MDTSAAIYNRVLVHHHRPCRHDRNNRSTLGDQQEINPKGQQEMGATTINSAQRNGKRVPSNRADTRAIVIWRYKCSGTKQQASTSWKEAHKDLMDEATKNETDCIHRQPLYSKCIRVEAGDCRISEGETRAPSLPGREVPRRQGSSCPLDSTILPTTAANIIVLGSRKELCH